MSRDAMDLSLMGKQARHNSERWFPMLHQTEDMAVFYGLALSGEIGEVCNLIKKYVRNPNYDLGGIGSELADVFTYLLLLADELHIDLLTEFENKQTVCEERWGK